MPSKSGVGFKLEILGMAGVEVFVAMFGGAFMLLPSALVAIALRTDLGAGEGLSTAFIAEKLALERQMPRSWER